MAGTSDPGALANAEVHYYYATELYHTAQISCRAALTKHGKDPVMKLWDSVALLMMGRNSEALRDLKSLSTEPFVGLAASLGMLSAHKSSKTVDKEAVAMLKSKVDDAVRSSGPVDLFHAALFLWHDGRHDKARDLANRILKEDKDSVEGLTARGWINMTCGRDSMAKKASKDFDDAIAIADSTGSFGPGLMAKLGKIWYSLSLNEPKVALELCNSVLGSRPDFVPARLLKAKSLIASAEWEAAMDEVGRIDDPHCVEGQQLTALFKLCRGSSGKGEKRPTGDRHYEDAARALGDLIAALDAAEPNNHRAYYASAQFASRMAGRHPLVLQQAVTLVERARSLEPNSADYLIELAYQKSLVGDIKVAKKGYHDAMQLDETSVSALTGMIMSQLAEAETRPDALEEATQQLEFLREIGASLGRTAELAFLCALHASKTNADMGTVVKHLDEAVDLQFATLEVVPISLDFFVTLSPDMMLQIVKLYLQYGPTDAPEKNHTPSAILVKSARVLEYLTRIAPGFTEALYLLAKVKFLSGAIDAAKSTAQYCLTQDNTYADAHLLMSRINLAQGNPAAARQSLEVGLSYNFDVKSSPLYYLIHAKIFAAQGNKTKAVDALNAAFKLPGVRTVVKSKRAKTMSLHDRVTVFLELARGLWAAGQSTEATKVIQDAMDTFGGTSEEMRVLIANADLAVQRGDVEAALAILGEIKPEQSYYVQAKQKMAEVYLHHRKDKKLYTICYKDLVERNPSGHTHLLLGDAYMAIQEPEEAISSYREALKLTGNTDSVIARKIGSAMVKTHNYRGAIDYYEASVKKGSAHVLRVDLANLYVKLRLYPNARKVIDAGLAHDRSSADLDHLKADVKLHMASAALATAQEPPDETAAIEDLMKAKEAQRVVLRRVIQEQPDALARENAMMPTLCMSIAEHYVKQGEKERAVGFYDEALRFDPDCVDALISVSRLYLSMPDRLDDAVAQLDRTLDLQPYHPDATIMRGDILAAKNDYEQAVLKYQRLLEREPNHYGALQRLVDGNRRAGQPPQAIKRTLGRAVAASRSPETEYGLQYCIGLHNRYSGDANAALKHFNRASRDAEWGQQALKHMIEIFLNPNDEAWGGEVVEPGVLEQVDTLLDRLAGMVGASDPSVRVLRAYRTLAASPKGVEDAMKDFTAIQQGSTSEAVAVPAHLGLARCYWKSNALQKAKAQLKPVQKAGWMPELAEDIEHGLLLLAKIHFKYGKDDLALDVLKKLLRKNKSSYKAWDLIGQIREKGLEYNTAALVYENAWSFCDGADPAIGYRLAFNYLKDKRFLEAITICHQIRKKSPGYTGAKAMPLTEILDRARGNLRLSAA